STCPRSAAPPPAPEPFAAPGPQPGPRCATACAHAAPIARRASRRPGRASPGNEKTPAIRLSAFHRPNQLWKATTREATNAPRQQVEDGETCRGCARRSLRERHPPVSAATAARVGLWPCAPGTTAADRKSVV